MRINHTTLKPNKKTPIDVDSLLAILKTAKKRKIKTIYFIFNHLVPEISEINISDLTKAVTIHLKKNTKKKVGKCNDCGKSKYLSYGKCGKCWKAHDKKNAIEAENLKSDIHF